MLILFIVLAGGAGLLAGVRVGLHIGTQRTLAALKLARYSEAIALADDLVATPDALDLRPRAQQILAAHKAATHRE